MKVELGNRRALAPGKLLWLRASGWAIGLFIIVLVVAALFQGIIIAAGAELTHGSVKPLDVPDPIECLALILMATGGVAAYLAMVRVVEDRWPPRELSLRGAARELAIGLTIGAAMMAVTVLIMLLAGWAVLGTHPVTTA